MRKLFMTVMALLAAGALLVGCGQLSEMVDALRSGGSTGVMEGAIGQRMQTYFFDFTVEDAGEADDFAGYTPGGGKLVVVTIKTVNTYGERLPMVDYDFQLQWGDRDDEADDDKYADVLPALDDSCAPGVAYLEDGESMTWTYVYEVPADASGFELCHLEIFADEDDNESYGDIHYVSLGF